MKHSHKIVFAFLLGGALALTLTNCSSGDPSEIGISGPVSSSSGDGGSSSSFFVDDGGGSSSSFDGGDSSSSFVDDEGGSSSSSDNGDDVSSSSASVCNGITYDPATQRCNSSVVETNCGGGWYNASTQFCHNGTNILSKCNGSTYDPQTQFCHNNAPFSKCGGTDYTPGTEDCCGNNKYVTATQRCNSSVVETNCGGDWYDVSNNNLQCNGSVIETKCGSSWYDALTQRCTASNVIETACGNSWYDASNTNLRCQSNVIEAECSNVGWYNVSTHFCNGNKIGGAVVIGNQTWMAENLNVMPATGNSWCYSDNPGYCNTYGRLYDWAAANSACPSGWKLPTQADWNTLTAAVGGASIEGKVLKATSGWDNCGPVDSSKDYVCEDTYGFSALPGGLRNSAFREADSYGYWWSATQNNVDIAIFRIMSYDKESASWSSCNKSVGNSVRCLKQ